MGVTRFQTSALVVVVAFAAGYATHCWQERPAPEVAQLKAARDSLAGEFLALRIRARARTLQDSQRAAAAVELERRAHASLAQTVALGAIVTRLSDSLGLLLDSLTKPDSAARLANLVPARDLLFRLGQAHEAEQQACIAAFSACDSALALERGRIVTRDSTIGEQRVLLGGYQIQLDSAIAVADLWSRRARRRVALGVSVGYGAIAAGGQVRVGPGAFVGIQFRF